MAATWVQQFSRPLCYIGVLGLAVAAAAHPRSAVGGYYRQWTNDRAARTTVAQVWDSLLAIGPERADSDSDTILVVFTDYQCSACRRFDAVLPDLMERIRFGIIYRHFPMEGKHTLAYDAAGAAICAGHQGMFTEMHSYLLRTRTWESDGDWAAVAREVDVPDALAFARCMSDSSTAARIAADKALAASLNVNAAPAFVGTGGISIGTLNEARLRKMLRK